MTKHFGEVKPSLQALVHAGVKGMKWGVRKTRVSRGEIHGATQRQEKRRVDWANETHASKTATTASARASAANRAKKIERDFNTNEDRVTATRMTRGEKIALAIVAGPAGLALIGTNKLVEKHVERSVDKERAKKG